MKYKTIIQVTTEAGDKNEAIEIVGEYLSGHISSGVNMKYSTRPIHGVTKSVITVTALTVLIIVGIFSAYHIKPSLNITSSTSGSNAVQPPLKTSAMDANNSEFKKEWKQAEAKKALDHIKTLNQ